MKRLGLMILMVITGLAFGPGQSKSADDKGTVVTLDGLSSKAPAVWKEEKPSNNMRFAQFKLPKVDDDSADAELVIFKGIGGSAKDNIARWKGFFVPPDGKKIDDVAKVTEAKVGISKFPYLQVTGTYKFKAAPFDPNSKEELKPNYTMLAVVYEDKDKAYHIRIVGPQKTVEHYRKGFEEWLEAFK